jgi:hypothetical protein
MEEQAFGGGIASGAAFQRVVASAERCGAKQED